MEIQVPIELNIFDCWFLVFLIQDLFCFCVSNHFQHSEMQQFQSFSILLLLCSSLYVATKNAEFQTIYIVSARCKVSEKFYFKNYSCFAKSYSRTFSTMNIITTSKMALNNIFVRTFEKTTDNVEAILQAEVKIFG